ncbi:hypothetical protein [Haloprofundus halobius]|uniref:hypothetical protein n=1 Tax=Haloprofundus halobius TaxID=2876194 RepID=UPI001CC94DCB|nr:hypothetical protein [Haloprofundus halobius]
MTDAAIPVTQSTVEWFTERYLHSLGCSIEKNEGHWKVTVPDGADSELTTGRHTLICGEGPGEENNTESLHPESAFFQRILREAAERCPTGKISIEVGAEINVPNWIQDGAIEVQDVQFTPYYDRTAIVFLFRVGIETVSEYQQELLRAVAVDARSEEHLPQLAETFLNTTSTDTEKATGGRPQLAEMEIRQLLDTARDRLLDGIEDRIDEIHQEASRAADAEVEEYRQMQQQRIQELEDEYSNLSSKIEELSEAISSDDQDARVRALKKRKEFKSDFNKIETALTDLQDRRDRGFPKRQREIRERHSLDVQITPLTLTEVVYERGEIDLDLIEDGLTRTVTLGYGSGIGATDTVPCSSCNEEFDERNPIQSIKYGLRCRNCTVKPEQ